jgi:dienelactone hydrolase
MRKLLMAASCLVLAAPAAPAEDLRDPETYPVASFLDWTGNPQKDVRDQRIGQYNFEEGMVGTARRAAREYPGHYASGSTDPQDVRDEGQVAYDSALHNRPKLPYSHPTDAGHPDYMPDWNRNRIFGEVYGDQRQFSETSDFDADTDGEPHAVVDADAARPFLDTGYFRYPCPQDDGTVWYENGDGVCRPMTSAPTSIRLGVAREVRLVDSRGLVLDGTLWIPGAAFATAPVGACTTAYAACTFNVDPPAELSQATGSFPGVVFANGLSSRQEHYYYLAERLARAGYVVLTYDPAGQGESEGTWADLFGFWDKTRACEQFSGACRDLWDAVRWFAGQAEPDLRTTGLHLDDRQLSRRLAPSPAGSNPARGILDVTRLGIAGNSMGAISTLNYLYHWGDDGKDPDGHELPDVAAAISLSGAQPTRAVVPIQFQTSDYDGSPLLVGPTAFGVNLGQDGDGIGYKLIKQKYDALRAAANPAEPGAMSLIVLEGGVHTDHVAVPFVTRTLWSNHLAGEYAVAWLDMHVGGAGNYWATITSSSGRLEHLSRAFASEEDPDGPAGGSAGQLGALNDPSYCIQVPDRASLNQDPDDFAARYAGHPELDDAVSEAEAACQ